MTMVDGWVVEKLSDDPAVMPFSAGRSSPAVVEEAPSGEKKKEKKKREKKEKAEQQEADVVAPTPEKVERFEPVKVVAPAVDLIEQPTKNGDSKASMFIGLGLGAAVLAGGAFFAWPYLASLLEPAEVAVFTASAPVDTTPTQRYVIEGDRMYLEGSVPNAEISGAIEQAASGALGVDRVINNFQITDDAVFDPHAPVRLTVAETVQFGTGRAEIAQQYAPLIALAVELMSSEPTVTLTIIGHTDNIGEEEENLRLSIERARSTANQIRDRGIDFERMTIDGRGESEPIASNESPEGRQANRRVEFLVVGLLG